MLGHASRVTGRRPPGTGFPRPCRGIILRMRTEDLRRELLDATGIDFGAYRHQELIESADVMSSMFDAIRRALLWAMIAALLVAVAVWIILRGDAGPIAGIVLVVIGVIGVAALTAGIWIKRLGGNLDGQAREVVRLAGRSVDQLSADLTNTDKPPSDRQLADGLLRVTVVPAMGEAVRNRVWLLGRPLASAGERILGGLLGRATARLESGSGAGSVVGTAADRIGDVIGLVGDGLDPVLNRFHRWLVRPLTWGLFGVALAAGVVFAVVAVGVS